MSLAFILGELRARKEETSVGLRAQDAVSKRLAEASAGDYKLIVPEGSPQPVSAATLNAATASGVVRAFGVELQSAAGALHESVTLTLPTPVPTESVADLQVGAPTTPASPKLEKGRAAILVTFDTDAGATKTYAAGVKAAGTITCVAGSLISDAETVTLTDADSLAKVFEFDKTGAATVGRVSVPIQDDFTAAVVAQTLATAINLQAALKITASASGAVVTVTQDKTGAAGNVAITETVANAGFIAAGFTGGANADSVAVPVKISADDKLLGFTVAPVTMTFEVV